jgi:hypothetical protein
MAMHVALNTNKELRKIGPDVARSLRQSVLLVNGGLMAGGANQQVSTGH